ncbi:MAG: class I SAM-dependent methyltransferase [Candidatus Kapaibacterium sp.]|nr:MAG: class I SAM-dependent methyltransferase [Candidatus Kapabacteria bacterium]
MSTSFRSLPVASLQERYRSAEWRGAIFRDILLHELTQFPEPTTLDIGCGHGFDADMDVQTVLGKASARYIGVEPDTEIPLNSLFTETHRCFFEDAAIEPHSVDLAFSCMVLEHLEHPQKFWDKLHEVLRPNGVFWGFTIDARSYFPYISLAFEKSGLKDAYLNALHGKRGEARYENYPVFYRSNSPRHVQALGKNFQSLSYINFTRVGQLDFYYPKPLQWIGRSIDRGLLLLDLPGNIFAVRAVK